ncbi:MAG TPA: hypothetical protein VFG90_06215 [Nitrososphaeraceae archaeon]|nr:hypothetical protein [Nitrososphaeraceae archaeon]
MNKSRTLGIIITLSIAMLGSTIVDFHSAQRLEAAKSGVAFLWCYSTPISPNDFLCYTNHEECSMIQSVDDDAKSDCLRKKNGS